MSTEALAVGETPDYREVELQDAEGNVRVAHICVACGHERVPGDWPDCRKTGDHVPGNFGEEPLEAYDDFNLGPGTVRVTTRGERRKLMAAANLEYVPKEKRVGATLYFDMKR